MSGALRPATHARLYEAAPQGVDANGTRHWITRAANFVVVVSDAVVGSVLGRADNADEYMLLVPPGIETSIEAQGDRIDVEDNSLTIIPPGASRVTVKTAGTLVRIFSNRAADIISVARNASIYADGAPEVAPLVAWPDPVGGFRLRHYALRDYPSADPSPLKMRVFRSTNLMINIFMPWIKRRDETKLSPHSHEDFEQISLGMKGAFVHHLRYPWTPNKIEWRADEHEFYRASPSVLVIPARVIHTTQDIGDGTTWLVDIFGPPRVDFSLRPGFVLNAADYPMRAQG